MFLPIFALFPRRNPSVVRVRGVGTAYNGKAFIRRFVFWLYRTSQLLNPVKNKATVDVRWVCFISALGVPARLCAVCRGSIYAYRRGLLRCSFNCTGQCEGLYVWDGQQVQTPALSSYMYAHVDWLTAWSGERRAKRNSV